jgi:UDP-GlcNAc:undecaprenyl-phosphate/decaprenyl-phosphate GlcNAc-1-phosphate transferase
MPQIAHPIVAFVVTVCVTPLAPLMLRRFDVVDRPGPRSSHDRPTLRGGGIAPAIGVLVALAISSLGNPFLQVLAFVTIACTLLGLGEDTLGIPTHTRLLVQGLIAAAMLPAFLGDLAGPTWWLLLFGLGSVLWMVAYLNAFNFMDGINGISAAQALIAGVAWLIVGVLGDAGDIATSGAIVAAAALAFLPFNFPNAKTFLGDAGSYFFGGYLAACLILGLRAGLPLEAMVAPLAIYLADTAWTLVQRIRNGETWHEAHRDHVYQRLVRAGWSHTQTTLYVGAIATLCAAAGILALTNLLLVRLLGGSLLVALMAAYLSTPHWAKKTSTTAISARGITARP